MRFALILHPKLRTMAAIARAVNSSAAASNNYVVGQLAIFNCDRQCQSGQYNYSRVLFTDRETRST